MRPQKFSDAEMFGALIESDGNRSHAAAALGVTISSVAGRVRRHVKDGTLPAEVGAVLTPGWSQDASRADRIVAAIADSIRERGYPPTYIELMHTVGLKTTSAVRFHIHALRREGRIEIDNYTARGIRVPVRAAANPCPTCGRSA